MIPEKRSVIYRSQTLFRFSFEREFDIDGFIFKENISNIKIIQADLDKICSYPILMLDDPKLCRIHPQVIANYSIDSNLLSSTFYAIPICIFFGNFFVWLYLKEYEYKTEFVFKKTNEIYNIPKPGELYRLVKKSIKNDIGKNIKFDIGPNNINGLPLFENEEEMWEILVKSKITSSKQKIITFNQEFTICQFAKPFYMPFNIDSLETEGKGGTYIQPVQILSVDQEKIGWLPLTVSRARYYMEKII